MSLLSRIAVEAARGFGLFAKKGGLTATYLAVAGGAGGSSGGGGAGGLLTSTFTLSTLNTYTITVGAGGVGGSDYIGTFGGNGANSVISGTGLSTVTAIGGGGGAPHGGNNGASGGSGGGAGHVNATTVYTGGAGTSGQGNAGGNTAQQASGGGGGAGAVGGNGTNPSGTATGGIGGNGGNGLASSISGSSVTYAGGGGGYGYNTGVGSGGTGGGGAASATVSGTAGTANLGGGGGAGVGLAYLGGQGGSGIVIISYPSSTPLFVGGTITTSGGNQIHTFTSSGTLSPITPITANYLVVAGGGGGGQGGGGAGGLLTSSTTLYTGASYIVTVGAGGTAGTNQAAGSNGSDSVVSGTGLTTITSTGGGRGGYFSAVSGASGGSGGGGGGSDAGGGVGSGGAGTSGQGYAGGSGVSINTTNGGGGGGGAGAAGGNAVASSYGGQGGVGVQSSISGTATYYAGGGSGGCSLTTTGGNGGGGSGGAASSNGTAGTANTGGGGGGGGNTTPGKLGGAGGSGIVIISYAGSQVFNGGLVTTSGGNTIHTFTSTGALTPLTNNLNNSLRFRGGNSAYLSRTPTLASNQKTWTWSAWIKLGTISTNMGVLFGAQGQTAIYINDGTYSNLRVNGVAGGDTATTALFRDPSAWYHVVVAVDTTQATAGNRLKIYVNGVQYTSYVYNTDPTLNGTGYINSTALHTIGRRSWSSDQQFDGYMTDINFIDGQALEPYYFGNNDANLVWKPIQYKGTYGTNGFYLTFGNTTSTTTLGYDSSPNGNNWTCNNISLTAGTTYDAMTDVPTNTSATVANYAVMNPLDKNTNITISDGNLKVTSSASTYMCRGTFGMTSGKWYWEVYIAGAGGAIGIATAQAGLGSYLGADAYGWGYDGGGSKYNNGAGTAYGASWTVGDTLGFAFDADAGTITCYKNNTSQGTMYSGLTSGPYFPATAANTSTNYAFNFGQKPFSYTPPTGYVALNTYNLPTPTILQGNKYMDATLYTSTGTSQVIVNQGQFQPDFVWSKQRNSANDNYLIDSVRGASKYLISNKTDAEATATQFVTSFNSNGFTMGTSNYANTSTVVAWQWQAGQGSTSSNTSGTITSTVSVNTTAGFSIVTYTGTGSNATVGHGLGVAPAMIITKQRNSTGWWGVYNKNLSAGYVLILQNSNASTNDSTYYTTTAPTSSVFSVGTSTATNGSSSTYVSYCWAEIAGFSKFGSYTGNGSADGPFVYCGFQPAYVLIKNTTSGTGYDWEVYDNKRLGYNLTNSVLYPDLSNAEATTAGIDILSNGFKLRVAGSNNNPNGATMIFMAFASNPFKNNNAR